MKQDSMKALVADADKFVPVQGEADTFIAEKGGLTVAYIIPTAPKGYGGPIKMLTAVSADGTVIDYTVLAANETPGLGDKGAKSPFKDQFKGKKITLPEHEGIALEVVKKSEVTNPSVQCDAVTGATLTTDGVSRMLQDCLGKYIKFLNDKNI